MNRTLATAARGARRGLLAGVARPGRPAGASWRPLRGTPVRSTASSASRHPTAGRLLPLGRNGKFPPSVVPVARGQRERTVPRVRWASPARAAPPDSRGLRGRQGRPARPGRLGPPGPCRDSGWTSTPGEHGRDGGAQPRRARAAGSLQRGGRPLGGGELDSEQRQGVGVLRRGQPGERRRLRRGRRPRHRPTPSTSSAPSDDDSAGTLVYRAPAGPHTCRSRSWPSRCRSRAQTVASSEGRRPWVTRTRWRLARGRRP